MNLDPSTVLVYATLCIFSQPFAPPGGVHIFACPMSGQLSQVCAESVHIFAYYPRMALSLCGSLRSPRPRSRGRAGQGQFFYTLSKPKLSHHKQITRWSLSLGHKHTILANSSSTIFHNRIIMRSSMRPRAHSPL